MSTLNDEYYQSIRSHWMSQMSHFLKSTILLAVIFISLPISADEWSVTNISLAHGDDHKLDDESQYKLTIDHARSWAYGDVFLFMDIFNPATGDSSEYGEIHPRFSLSKISGKSFQNNVIRDASIATEVEFGEKHRAYLYGLGIDLNTKDFNYFNINFYVRDNKRLSGKTWQITPYWQLPFSIGKSKWSFEGFADIAGSESSSEHNILFQPQLLLDIGHLVGKPGQLQAGIEHVYWRNKFGVKGVTESMPQLMIKWTFK